MADKCPRKVCGRVWLICSVDICFNLKFIFVRVLLKSIITYNPFNNHFNVYIVRFLIFYKISTTSLKHQYGRSLILIEGEFNSRHHSRYNTDLSCQRTVDSVRSSNLLPALTRSLPS